MKNYNKLISKQRSFFRTNTTKEMSFRIDALQRLRTAIQNYEKELMKALKADLNKLEFDAYSTEIGVVLEEIRFTLKHLRSWVKPQE